MIAPMRFALILLVACSPPPPRAWEVAAYNAKADAAARAWHDDAELVLLIADRVDAQGMAHLDATSKLKFEYRSQADLEKTRAEHVGVSAGRPPNCLFAQYIHDRRTQLSSGMRTGDCAGPRLGPVRCTVQQVWTRAVAKGAPAGGTANLELHLSGDRRRWRFVAPDRDLSFDDDC